MSTKQLNDIIDLHYKFINDNVQFIIKTPCWQIDLQPCERVALLAFQLSVKSNEFSFRYFVDALEEEFEKNSILPKKEKVIFKNLCSIRKQFDIWFDENKIKFENKNANVYKCIKVLSHLIDMTIDEFNIYQKK